MHKNTRSPSRAPISPWKHLYAASILALSVLLAACMSDDSSSSGGSSSSSQTNSPGNVEEPPVVTPQVVLNWTAPDRRENGEPINNGEIAGFQVHYGQQSGEYAFTLETVGASSTVAEFTDLDPGTWYFAVVTIDTDGRQSRYSEERIAEVH